MWGGRKGQAACLLNEFYMGQKVYSKLKGLDWSLVSAVCRGEKSFHFSELLFPCIQSGGDNIYPKER